MATASAVSASELIRALPCRISPSLRPMAESAAVRRAPASRHRAALVARAADRALKAVAYRRVAASERLQLLVPVACWYFIAAARRGRQHGSTLGGHGDLQTARATKENLGWRTDPLGEEVEQVRDPGLAAATRSFAGALPG
jgi:hypothetical protein